MAVTDTDDTGPDAWVLRCPQCRGGLLYGIGARWSRQLLALLHDLEDLAPWVETGAIDRLWELDYCTCEEPPV